MNFYFLKFLFLKISFLKFIFKIKMNFYFSCFVLKFQISHIRLLQSSNTATSKLKLNLMNHKEIKHRFTKQQKYICLLSTYIIINTYFRFEWLKTYNVYRVLISSNVAI